MGLPKNIAGLTARSVLADLTDIIAIQKADGSIPVQKIPLGLLPFIQAPGDANVVIAGAAIRPSVNAGVVSWNFLVDSEHGPVFFNGIEKSPSTGTRIRILYPAVTSIVTFLVGPDETAAPNGLLAGATVDVASADIEIAQMGTGVASALYQGNGTTWVRVSTNYFSFPGVPSGSRLYILPDNTMFPFDTVGAYGAHYEGAGIKSVSRLTAGLGPYNVGWELYDNSTGTPVLSVPQATDFLQVTSGNILNLGLDAYDPGFALWNNSLLNLWIIALFTI